MPPAARDDAPTERDFRPLKALKHLLQDQQPRLCGPASLSSCLAILGIEASDEEVMGELPYFEALAARLPSVGGTDERQVVRAARRLKATATMIPSAARGDGNRFLTHLSAHIRDHGPVVLLINKQNHFVALLDALEEPRRWVVMDPSTRKTDVGFFVWDDAELLLRAAPTSKSGFSGVQLAREDGAGHIVRITPQLVTAANAQGLTSGARLGEAYGDWAEILGRKGTALTSEGVPLHEWLADLEFVVVEALDYWRAKSVQAESRERIERRFRDYVATLSTLGVLVADEPTRLAILAELVSILSYYAGGRSSAAKPVGVTEAFSTWNDLLRKSVGGEDGLLLRAWLPALEAVVVDALDVWRAPSAQAESRAAIQRRFRDYAAATAGNERRLATERDRVTVLCELMSLLGYYAGGR